MLGHFAPAFKSDIEKRCAPLRIVEILVREDGELRAHARSAEFGGNIGKGLEPVDVVAADIRVRMAEMVEPAIRSRHAGGDPHAGPRQCLFEQAEKFDDRRRRPARIDEFVRQLHVADADAIGDGVDQVVGLGEAVDQRVCVQGKRESHQFAAAMM